MIITPEEAQRKLRNQADRAFRALVLEAAKRIIYRTPVDTGRARGNWHTSIDVPEFRADEDTDKAGAMTLAEVDGKLNQIKDESVGRVVYLTNGLPYIVPLENGSSKQNPAGMVKVTLAELRPIAEQVAAKVRALQ